MKQQERILLAVMAIGLSLLLIIRDVFGIELSKYIYLAYVVFFLFIAKYETMVYMVFFTLPLVCGLPATYIMLCALALLMIKKKKVNRWQLGMLLFVAAMEIFASFWYPKLDISFMMQYISHAGIMFYLIHDTTEVDNLRCVKMYTLGVCLLCVVIATTTLMYAPDNWLERFSKGLFRFGATQMSELEGMKLKLNANSLAYYSLTGMCCGTFLIEKAKGSGRFWYAVMIGVSAVAGFFTVSRSWLLVVAICVFLYMLSKAKRPGRFAALVLGLVLMLLLTAQFVGGLQKFIDAFTTRLNDENMESGGGRLEIFERYMRAFFANPRAIFFGAGVSQYSEALRIGVSIHNGTQQLLVSYGVFGFIFVIVALFRPVAKACAQKKHGIVSWLPLIGIILFVQTIQFLNPMMLMLPFVVGVYALKADDTNDRLAHKNIETKKTVPTGTKVFQK